MRRSKRKFARLVGAAVLLLILIAVAQIDIVHQYLEVAWINLNGDEWRLRGSCTTLSLWSTALRERRAVIVYTPPGYMVAAESKIHYPVLYLLHGSPDPGYGWSQYGRAQEDVDRLIVLENYPPMIVVMPDGNGQGTFGDSEYVDAPSKQKNGKPGLKVGTYITQDVVNWTDSHYRTIRSPRGRLIGGVSTGGYGAANLGLQNPDIYGAMMSFSGYYRADPTGWARPVWGYHPAASELYSQSPIDFVNAKSVRWRDTIVILGDGLSDRSYYRRDTDNFDRKLKSCRIEVLKFRYPGRHSWDLWRALLRTSLRSLRSHIPDKSTESQ